MNPNLKNIFAATLLLAVLAGQFFHAPQRVSAAPCDAATFVADVTVPDGTIFPPTTAFVKTWRIKNSGTCTWTTSYKLAFAGGTPLSGPEEVALPAAVAPGGSVDLSINLVSLAGDGRYRGYWQLKNAAGARFGIGTNADKPFWVEIVVRGGVPSTAGYDFVANSGLAKWQSGAGALIFPGQTGDVRGFAQQLTEVKLETGATINERALLMTPQNKTDGYIQALFPVQPIHNGDRFQATIGCQHGATTCYVTFRIDYRTSTGVKTLWTFKEKYEGLTYNVNLDLSALAGKNVEFFLMVLATGSPNGDRAVWIAPRVTRGASAPTATQTPVASATLQTPGTNTPVIPTSTSIPVGDGYSLATNGNTARWQSGAGALTFPGANGDARGFALKLDTVQMETGATVNAPALLMVPQNKLDGYIQGLFPAQIIQNGDRLQATIGCQYGATACYVTYRIDYRTSAGVKPLWTFREKYDGLTYNVNLDLSALAGKSVEFFLLVLASGSPSADRAVWIAPRITRIGSTIPSATPTPTLPPAATLTPTPTTTVGASPTTAAVASPTSTVGASPTNTASPTLPVRPGWQTYVGATYHFQFQYPPEAQIGGAGEGAAHILLPFTPGTNLGEKYLDVTVMPNTTVCTSPLTNGYAPGSFTSTPVTINGIDFIKESGSDAGAGNIYQWTAYSVLKNNNCISLNFVLHSTNPGNHSTPPPVFNEATESAVFAEIMSTFGWLP